MNRADIERANTALKEANVPPATCEECGAAYYIVMHA
jgi:hypothetical protein